MSLKSRFRNIAAAFLMVLSTVAPIGNGLVRTAYADDLGVPEHSKTLTENKNTDGTKDGTATITLSVTGKAASSSNNKGANVVVVLDTSGSMRYFLPSDTGRYGSNNANRPASTGDYYDTNVTLYTNNNCRNAITNNTTKGPVYYLDGRWCREYTGQRYDSSSTRFNSAKSSLTKLFSTLLDNNTSQDPDLVEVSFITFAENANLRSNWTTSESALTSAMNSNQVYADGGTNWDDALRLALSTANAKHAQDGDDTYVIFITDGNPTFYHNCYSGYGCNGDDTNTTTVSTSYNAAAPQALNITNAGYELYNLGVYGNVDRMQSLTNYANESTKGEAHYFEARDEAEVDAAFSNIVSSITNSLSITDITLVDGITGMTEVAIEGTAGDFKYTKGGKEWTNAPQAKFENGKVTWDLGDTVLANGETATVSFIVYPSQESIDLVADLNNGVTSYDDLTPDQKTQIIEKGGKYYLKTNTDYPTLTYRTVTTTTIDGESTTVVSDPKTVEIENPEPLDLYTEEVELQKIWEDSLDPKQRAEEVGDIYLQFFEDGNEIDYTKYKNLTTDSEKGIKISNQSGDTWASGDIFIAPGLMVSEGHPAYNEHAHNGVITMNGKKYAILNTGHEYKFGEKDINGHFELTNYIYHPMLVDGVLMNVKFTMDGDKITGVESAKEMSTISATNTLKGGINIQKQVVDEEGHAVAANEVSEKFNIKAHLVNSDGNAYSYDYRIYCTTAHDNCTEEVKDDTGAVTGYRSDHIYGSGLIDANIYAQDTIRIVNVHNGTLFYVEEDNIPTGYEQSGISYQISNGSTSNYHNYEDTTELNGKTYYAVVGNAAAAATITNKYTSGKLKISKTVNVTSGDEKSAKSNEFNFTVKLYSDANKTKELTGSYKYSGSKSGTIKSGDTIKLKDGESIEIDKLPEGAYYEVTEASVAGFKTTKSGDTGTIVKNETAEAKFTNTYSVSGKVTIKAKKDLQGRDWLEDEKFTFTLTGNGENQSKEIGKGEVAEFEVEIKDDGSFTYTISEDTSGLGKRGITKTTEDIDVIVTASDNGDGTLKFTMTYPDEKDEAIIVNTYKSSGTAQLEAGKILTGRDWMDGEQYTFSMLDENGTVIDEQIVDADETVTFDEITYTNEDAGKTFVYIIRETSTLPDGMTKSGDIKATVEVTDNNDGTISTKITYENGNTITNTYTANGEISLEAAKELVGRNWLEGESYNFELKDSEGKTIDTQTVDENETVTFKTIKFTEADAGKTYTYTITETGELKQGLTKSQDITATVKVTDNKNGKLNVSVEYTNNDKITNTYKATGSTSLKAKKVLEGRDWQKDESYVFALIDSEGNVVERQTVDANETVSFAALNYTEADAGKTYTYTISEVSDLPGGLAKSDDIQVTIEVVDNGDGSVTANVTYTQNDTITNTYSANGSIVLEATKELTGRDWMENEQYTFALKNSDGEIIDEQVVDENETVSFDKIEYTKAGTYHYTIEETSKLPDSVESSGPINVTVEVTDNFDGTLTAVATYGENNDNTITNSYTAKGDIELKATKKLEGRAWLEGESFDFELFDETGKSLDKQTVTESSPIATFKKLNFTEADAGRTYTYTIKETSELPGGLKKSDDITVTVTVEDNKNGSLTVTADYTNDGIITNTYEASGKVVIEAEKELVGRDWLEGESYNFELKDSDGKTIDTVAVNKNGKVSFKEIEYTEADAGKTFTYTITETGELKSGLTKSGDLTVTVEVTDDGAGNLTATATYTNGKKITNTYKASGDITLDAEKELVGRDWLEGESYNFELKDSKGNTIDTVEVNKNGRVTFKNIKYTEADAGKTYTYTVTETGKLANGLTKSDDLTIEVTIADNGDGTLEATANYTNGKKITNTYSANGKVTLEAEKELVGRDWIQGESYNFVLKTADGETIDTVEVNKNGKVSFKELEYTQADAGQTYNFIITEEGELKSGLTKSDDIQVKVTITDNGDGTLSVTAEYVNGNKITNTYTASGDATIEAEKELTGRDWLEGESYNFELKDSDGNTIDTVTVSKNGKVSFDKIEYDQTDAGKTYTYTVTETGNLANGLTKSDDLKITVKVTDNGDGTLTAEVSYENGQKITNTYKANGSATISAEKELTGRDWLDGESYNFELKDSDGKTIDTVEVNKNGKVEFKPLEYTEADAGKTYTYTITETGELKSGLTKSDDLTVTVKVIDNGDGTLETEVSYENGQKITNTYEASGEITLEAEKELVGRDWLEGESYNFELKDSEGKTVGTVDVDKNGKVSFDAIKYTEADAGKTYTYTITETGELKSGLTKSDDITVTVTITDNGDGTLKVEAKYTNDGKITNTYKATGSTTIDAEKQLVGRDWLEGESYNFVLKTADGETIDTQIVDKNGKISFKNLEYTEADAGKTYNFIITEEGELKSGLEKSDDIQVKITIEDNGDGTLNVTAEYVNGNKITNTYTAKPVDYMPEATKVLLGRELKDKEFDFEVYLDGKLVATGHNAADGTITFSNPISFDKAGVYTITIKEVKGSLKNIQYDTTVFTFTVTVTDNNEGQLVAEASEEADNVVFVNKYVGGKGGNKNPVTFDGIMSYIALFFVSVGGLIGSVLLGRRKSNEKE